MTPTANPSTTDRAAHPVIGQLPDLAPHRRYTRSSLQPAAVTAGLGYVKTAAGRPYNYMYEPPDGGTWHNCEYEVRNTRIVDARLSPSEPTLDGHGFELWNAPTKVDFRDADEVSRLYYGEMGDLALAATGGQHAMVFDHVIRKREAGRPPLTFGRHGDGSSAAAVGRIHNDYSEDSGRRRLGVVLSEAQQASSVSRYAIVNIWRSIAGPVLDTPLAVCDARTVQAKDVVITELRYPTRLGEIYLLQHSLRHRWYYYSAMDCHEALVFKQYDSQVSGTSRFTFHCAFDLPEVPEDAPLRESIEVRCLVTFD